MGSSMKKSNHYNLLLVSEVNKVIIRCNAVFAKMLCEIELPFNLHAINSNVR